MPTNVVADTNLYYDLAEGRAKRADIVSGDEVLFCSPLSVIEIVSKMDEKNFVQRRNAVRAMLEHGAKVTGQHHNCQSVGPGSAGSIEPHLA